jgi:hypothetical protein
MRPKIAEKAGQVSGSLSRASSFSSIRSRGQEIQKRLPEIQAVQNALESWVEVQWIMLPCTSRATLLAIASCSNITVQKTRTNIPTSHADESQQRSSLGGKLIGKLARPFVGLVEFLSVGDDFNHDFNPDKPTNKLRYTDCEIMRQRLGTVLPCSRRQRTRTCNNL